MIFDKIVPPATIHMIGIGGISMSGLAEILKDKGYIVKGSDMNDSSIIQKLKKSGINVTIGHDKNNVGDADAVIFTAAIKKDNPEYVESETRGIPLIERSVLLGEITRMFPNTIAIAGTHGKTTTTSMVSLAFMEAGLDPTITVGGELKEIDGNYRVGDNKYLITEACEYVESFLQFSPKVAIILNVEADHLDYYKNLENVKNAFYKFENRLPEDGYAILNVDDPNSEMLIQNNEHNKILFGIKNEAEYNAKNIIFEKDLTTYDLYIKGRYISKIELKVPGIHNVYNSLACIAACNIYNIDVKTVASALYKFGGAKRRFERKGEFKGALIYDDYAHHPSEIKATLLAAKEKKAKRIWCVFQPHTYTRTKTLLNEFSEAFYNADNVIITDIYAAREKDTGEISSKDLVEKIKDTSKNAVYMKDFKDIENFLKDKLEPGDLFLTIGAGDVYKIGEDIIGE